MYEIKKETKSNQEVFIYLYYKGSYVVDSARLLRPERPETECIMIEELKRLIKNHKENGTFQDIETIYTED
jgi:hypothetical protein